MGGVRAFWTIKEPVGIGKNAAEKLLKAMGA